ncbi:hypothetical protein AB4358_01290, partial [Vibrio sp. 10N.261.49.A11]
PSVPSAFNLHSIAPSSGKTLFSWGKSEGATEYQLCLKDDTKLNSCEVLATTSSLSAEVSGLGAIKSLTSPYFVIAKNTGGNQSSNDKYIAPDEVSQLIQYLKASNTGEDDNFGSSVSLSADGTALAVGALSEDSDGVGGKDNDDARDSGAVYLFRFTGGVWAQEAYLKASNVGVNDQFGSSVSLSADGDTLAVGAPSEDSDGVGGEGDDSFPDSGAVYLFRFTGGVWAQEAYLKASNAGKGDEFGSSVSLSADGTALAVGAIYEDSSSMGVGGEDNDDARDSGAVYLFRFTGDVWAEKAYLKASNAGKGDEFGSSVSLSA